MAKYTGIQTLEVLEWAKNYNKWIASNFTHLLKGPVLEVGTGTGNISGHFLDETQLFLSDSDNSLVKYLRQKFNKSKNVKCIFLDIRKTPQKSLQSYFNTVISINVFEHLKEDNKALENINSLLKKGGKLLLLVPAKKFAYSRLDKSLGHYRRYEKDELVTKLEDAKFKIEQIYFFNIVGLASWVIREKVEKNHSQLTWYQIALFEAIVPFLRKVENIWKPPIGISLIVVATKI